MVKQNIKKFDFHANSSFAKKNTFKNSSEKNQNNII
jgi:hypothetical protein